MAESWAGEPLSPWGLGGAESSNQHWTLTVEKYASIFFKSPMFCLFLLLTANRGNYFPHLCFQSPSTFKNSALCLNNICLFQCNTVEDIRQLSYARPSSGESVLREIREQLQHESYSYSPYWWRRRSIGCLGSVQLNRETEFNRGPTWWGRKFRWTARH